MSFKSTFWKITGLILFSSLLFIALGCSGGSGSPSAPRVDTVGITTTLAGFMQSVKTGNGDTFLSPRMKELAQTSGGIHTLIVNDFGEDINNPDDNNSYEFTIPEDGIVQYTDSEARAYAIRNTSTQQLRIDFILEKIGDQWYIASIEYTAPPLGYVTAARLVPLRKNNEWRSIMIPIDSGSTLSYPTMIIGAITSDPVPDNSRNIYTVSYSYQETEYNFNLANYSSTIAALKTTDSWAILKNLYSAVFPTSRKDTRAGIIDLFTQPDTGTMELGYSTDLGFYQHGTPYFNSGKPVKILDPTATVGDIATETVQVQWNDGSTYQVFMASRLARKITVNTFAGSFEAYQIDSYARFLNSVPSDSNLEMYWSRLYSVDTGEVAAVEWDRNGNPAYIYLLYSATVNGRSISPLDNGTTPINSGLVMYSDSALPSATAGQPYSQQIVSGGSSPYTHTVLSGQPPSGFSIDSAGYFVGTPTSAQVGNYSFTVEITDATGKKGSATYSFIIDSSGTTTTGSALAFTTTTPPSATIGQSYNATLATGGTPPYTFSLASGQTLPANLSFTANGLGGTPDTGTDGTYSLDITITDAVGASVNNTVSLVINVPLQFTMNAALPTKMVGEASPFVLVTGGRLPYSFSTVSGSLTAGLSYSSNGLQGSVTTANTYSFTVQAVDADGTTISRAFTQTVVPTFAFSQGTTLPTAVTGMTYNQTLVTGGQGPYTSTITSGALPGGLTASGSVISGTVDSGTAAGNYTIGITVNDSLGHSVSDTFTLPVSSTMAAPSLEWQKVYGSPSGTSYNYEAPRKIFKTSNDHYLIVGNIQGSGNDVTAFNGGTSDCWAVKIDSTGAILWQKNYGGSSDDYFYAVTETSDGNYVLVGQSKSSDMDLTGNNGVGDIWLVKVSSADGSIIWQKNYGGSNDEAGLGVAYNLASGLFITGYTYSSNGDFSSSGYHVGLYSDLFVMSVNDSDGSLSWVKCYGGTQKDEGYDMVINSSNELFVVGACASTDGDRSSGAPYGDGVGSTDVWVLKLDTSGGLLRQTSHGGSSSDLGRCVKLDADGSLVISGETRSSAGQVTGYHSGTDAWVFKLDTAAQVVWSRSLGGTFEEIGYGVEITPDGGCVVVTSAGSSDGDVQGFIQNMDAWIVKLNSSGAIVWQRPCGGTGSEIFYGVTFTGDNKLIAVGTTNSNTNDLSGLKTDTQYDWYLAKFASY
ncbi:MAG: hypothetical protein Kow0029_18140 [Candidatus Rifleibacteriota bacterium]